MQWCALRTPQRAKAIAAERRGFRAKGFVSTTPDMPVVESEQGSRAIRSRVREQRSALPGHASSSRPEGVAPLDVVQWRRLGRRTLLLDLAKAGGRSGRGRSSSSSTGEAIRRVASGVITMYGSHASGTLMLHLSGCRAPNADRCSAKHAGREKQVDYSRALPVSLAASDAPAALVVSRWRGPGEL